MTDTISSYLPSEQAAIISAVLAGNRDFMTQEQIENYRDSGLAHFLSISGLHMSMLAGLMFFFVRFFMALIPALSLRYNSKKVAAVLAFVVSTVYLLVSGAEVPTQRAYIMTFMVLLAVIFERQAISMRILAIAALIILIISPQALVNISFQLSFAAVAGHMLPGLVVLVPFWCFSSGGLSGLSGVLALTLRLDERMMTL
jgi:competence protein ComEC